MPLKADQHDYVTKWFYCVKGVHESEALYLHEVKATMTVPLQKPKSLLCLFF
jgi:hypothetical protein